MSIKNNPVFWLMWLLPASAVAASFATLAIALSGADRSLPATYHWEGAELDADFDRARRAAELGIRASLHVGEAGQCVLRVDGASGSAPLRLLLTHSRDASRDRQVLLKPVAAGEYRAACTAVPVGRWRIALDDDAAGWSLRARVDGGLEQVSMVARHPDGPGA